MDGKNKEQTNIPRKHVLRGYIVNYSLKVDLVCTVSTEYGVYRFIHIWTGLHVCVLTRICM